MFFRVEATHRHHLTNVFPTTREKWYSIHFPQQAEKDCIQSLNEKRDTCSSSFRVTIKFFLTILHLPIFCQKLPEVKFPLSTILKNSHFADNCQKLPEVKFPLSTILKNSHFADNCHKSNFPDLNHLKNSHALKSFLLYHNCAHKTWITLHNHIEQKLSNLWINTKIEQIYFLFRKRFKFL